MKPSKNCPYCGSTHLAVKRWGKQGTYFVACLECRQAGPSLAKTEEEACELFDRRAETTQQAMLGVFGEDERENQLKDLVKDMYTFIAICDELRDLRLSARGRRTLGYEQFAERMRELGIEAEKK